MESKLTISNNQQKPLSKNQLLFNKLATSIESLEKAIEKETNQFEELVEVYNKNLFPIDIKIANLRIELAKLLAKVIENVGISKKKHDSIIAVINDLCKNAFYVIDPSPEQIEFYNQWSETEYNIDIEYQIQEKEEPVTDFKSQKEGEETDSKIQQEEEIKDSTEKKEKTKKQFFREERAKASESVKKKSIRCVYIALAKVLHPDTEIEPVLKLEKEELMKKVTVAYSQKDMATLLKLEMDWVHKEKEHLESLSDEKLKIYISALKQQATELEQRKAGLYSNPRYSVVSSVMHMPVPMAISRIVSATREGKSACKSLTAIINEFKIPNRQEQMVEFVNEYYNDLDED